MASNSVHNDDATRSSDWIEDVISNLAKKDNEDLIRTTLEAHRDNQPDKAEEEKQAYAWVQWARQRQHVKVVTSDIPDGILPKGEKGLLHDGRVFSRGPDDSIYDNNLDVRQKVARGNCFLELLRGENAGLTCLVYAMKKFTGGMGDDDDRQSGDKQVWKKYFTKPMEEAKVVVATRKANGEAAHLSARRLSGEIYICAGSKNVHLLVKSRDDIAKYTDSRYQYAREICHTILDLTNSIPKDAKRRLLNFLCETKLTAVMEMLSPRHQHVEDFSHMTKTELRFITWTSSNLESTADNLCCMPPHVGIDIAQSLGLPTVDYEMVQMDALEDRMRTIRQGYGYEGEVLYFLDSDNTVIGLLKKKTIWYIVCRAIREKLRAACNAYAREKGGYSVSTSLKKLEKRCDEIQLWLSLDQETTNEWKTLGGKCLRWMVARLKSGELEQSDIADLFPVTWKKYLSETDQTDHIKARDYDDASGSGTFSSD